MGKTIGIKTLDGTVLFSHTCEYNTIKITVEEAAKSGANLYGANLTGANLYGADLSGTNLYGADLSGANLTGADLSGASVPIYCKWSHSIKGNIIKIGCKGKTIEEWGEFFASDEEFATNRGTDEFKQIEAVYLAYKAYYQHLNK